eukprot:GHVU01077910.1.p1 GENE.GHVU01077910.1~~GHVU01077910.1.p1  ORF type:complete len:245 (-),score=27.04 GHVU01077910.1:280-1014(-)
MGFEFNFQPFVTLRREVERLMETEERESKEDAKLAADEMLRCLVIKGKHPDPFSLSLPSTLDQAWQYAILNTEDYRRFCEAACGKLIEHRTWTAKSEHEQDSVGTHNSNRLLDVRKLKMWEIYVVCWGQPKGRWWGCSCGRGRTRKRKLQDSTGSSSGRLGGSLFGKEIDIKVKTLANKVYSIAVRTTDTVETVKERIQCVSGICPCQQRLVFAGRRVSDQDTVTALGIGKGSELYLVLRTPGT